MRTSLDAARAEGTKRNHDIQARKYLTFMFLHNFNYLYPQISHLLLFYQCLANSYKNTQTAKNYMAGAKTFVKKAGGFTWPFDNYWVKELQQGCANLNNHEPSQAPRVPMKDLCALSNGLLAMGPGMSGERAAILIMFSTLLRQSNVLYCSSSGGRHLIQRRHLLVDGDTIWVHVPSTKATRGPSPPALPVQRIGTRHCPYDAWLCHLQSSPGMPSSPACLTWESTPILPYNLLSICRFILNSAKSSLHQSFTFHSLRRTGANEAHENGASQADIREMGLWSPSSPAFHSYVPRKVNTNASKAIAKSLASQK